MRLMIEQAVAPSAQARSPHRFRPLIVTVALLAAFIGLIVFLALVVAPWASAAGGCGGG
jgi:hypothetical protein